MYNTSFFKKMLVAASLIFLYSCDKEYNAIGDELIGDNHFDLLQYSSDVVAYNQKVGAIQSNNLPLNALGIYNDGAFGKTTANFATQIVLATPNPTIGEEAVIDSVYLTVPYFSTLKTTNADGSHEYELDSIYGADKAKIKLSVYESGYFMRDLDPIAELQENQKYFTDQNADFDNLKQTLLNDNADTSQNTQFFFDSEEIVETTKDADNKVTTTRSVPAMRLKLNAAFFANKIINAPTGKLATNDVFKDYFKGLYFKVEDAGSAGSMAMLNFKLGKITIKYKAKTAITTDAETVKEEQSIVLNLTGNTVSLLQQSNANTDYTTAVTNPDTSLGDERLYVKGGEGSMSIIDLFSTPGQLETIRQNNWLINEANLVFHIDTDKMATGYEPNRIYLYDLNNNRPLVDYYNDATTSSDTKKAKYVFDGIINKEVKTDGTGRGLTYKIRITNQIRNLIKNADSTNVKLGLVVTEDISTTNTTVSQIWETPINVTSVIPSFYIQTPRSAVMNPLGTVLYGSNPSVPADKRLKLEIYYTKPN